MADLRFSGQQSNVQNNFTFQDLHYFSAHSLGTEEQFDYGRQRLHLYLSNSWIEKKFEHAGLKFSDSEVELTQEELKNIPYASAKSSLDSIKFEVIVRAGSKYKIHEDEAKYWESQASSHSDLFKKHKESFEKQHACLLSKIVESGFGVVAPPPRTDNASEAVVFVDDDKVDPVAKPAEHDSFQALNAIDPISLRTPSEISDIELLLGESGHTYMMSKKNKTIGKSQMVGGFSSGKYFPADHKDPGVAVCWPEGDQTLIQVDQSGIKPENTNVDTMSLYKYCVMLEASKKITEHKFSYSTVERKTGDGDTDGFMVDIKTPSKYVTQHMTKDDHIALRAFRMTLLDIVQWQRGLMHTFPKARGAPPIPGNILL